MGLVIGDHQKVVVVQIMVFLQEIDRLVGTAVSEGELRLDVMGLHAVGLAGKIALLGREFVQVIAHVVPVIGIPAVRASAKPEVVASVQMPFSDVGAVDAVVAQPASDILDIVGQSHAV